MQIQILYINSLDKDLDLCLTQLSFTLLNKIMQMYI